mmetsp:Transcript_1273/g.3726  ORF Transcript_1273/g.3726 Transcript_1273/m.3726 type:complete len:229 (+) Transcript_1273:712-1398(+)
MTTRAALLALALAAHGDACFRADTGGCADAGYVDWQSSPEACQVACLSMPGCESFEWRGGTLGLCDLCTAPTPGAPKADAVWGPRSCDAADEPGPVAAASEAVAAAHGVCADPDPERDMRDRLEAAARLSAVVKLLVKDELSKADFAAAASQAAALLERADCAPTPCNGGAILWSTLEMLLLALDGDAARAFPHDVDLYLTSRRRTGTRPRTCARPKARSSAASSSRA